MNILWVDLVSELGGAQHSMFEVCTTLPALGVKVVAAVPYGPLFDLLKGAGLTVYPVSAVRAKKRGWGLFTSTAKLMRAPGTIGQIIRDAKPDIVHANGLAAFFATSLAAGSVPVFWHVRDIQIPPLVAHEASKKAGRIIAASEAIDERLVDILSPRILGRIRVIRNGIDPKPFSGISKADARTKFGLPPGAPVIGMIAHIVPWKRHDAFIQAAVIIRQHRPDAQFFAVGRDLFGEHARHTAKLIEQIAQAGLTGCFKWIKDLDAPESILPAFDVLLHPALNEPFGRIICEAMAARVPVIAADSAGPATIIKQRVSGILVKDGDPQLMAEEALSLLNDPERGKQMTEEGYRTVSSQYTTRRVCEQLVKEYQSALVSLSTSTKTDDE